MSIRPLSHLLVGLLAACLFIFSRTGRSGSPSVRLKIPIPTNSVSRTPGDDMPNSLVERVRDTGFLQLYAESFKQKPLKQQVLAYWLSMAAIAVNPIVYDQNSAYGLRIKHLLEQILTYSQLTLIRPYSARSLTTPSSFGEIAVTTTRSHPANSCRSSVRRNLNAAATQALKSGAKLGGS